MTRRTRPVRLRIAALAAAPNPATVRRLLSRVEQRRTDRTDPPPGTQPPHRPDLPGGEP
ncbi:hypothetical protein GCM10012275_47840 [Longimycelium tulufanense]|uniref:Uncharacterized protein n=1 Tax=Longimycelium tulufanense TaxID=907463 RepID=A0A8J3FVV1_9PSEU|nr:hypothetical protein [Longimycelium tulufanense]GGM71786.1 hypothetical protein GCM10012275_47840 [Longimycelium tulufanense]